MRIPVHSLVALFVRVSLLSTRCRADAEEPSCFMVSSDDCFKSKLGPLDKCELIEHGVGTGTGTANIFCCNITNERELNDFFNKQVPHPDRILGFHMRDSSLEKLEISVFDRLKRLTSFSITNTNMTHITGAFDGPSSLKCLNISQNMIIEMHPFILLKLKELKNIVMMNNTNITTLPEFPKELRGFKLDVSGNSQLSCKYLINLTMADVQKTMTFVLTNRNFTICTPPQSKMFTDSAIYVNMEHLDAVREIFYECPNITDTIKCACSVHSLDRGENETLTYHALVNCSSLFLTSLPLKLPTATRVLDISHNNITSLEGIGNKTYNNIRELYANNNKITSLKPLEGTPFFTQFQNISLRNNKIDQIQIYILADVFDRLHGTYILLGDNEFRCDCNTASQIRIWLNANKDHVPDYLDIYAICDGSRIRITDLSQKALCAKQKEWKDYIRYVIYGEILVFAILIGKVSYDYYIFKTFGYLPWPASRMPKLPCDWCFET